MKEVSNLVVCPSRSNHASSHHLALTRAVPLALLAVLLAAPAQVRGSLTWSATNSFGFAEVTGFNDEATITNSRCVDWKINQGIVTDTYQTAYNVGYLNNGTTVEYGGLFHVRGSGTPQKFHVWTLATLGSVLTGAPPPANGSMVTKMRKVCKSLSSGGNADLPDQVSVIDSSTTNFDAQAVGNWYDTCWHHARIALTNAVDDGYYWFMVTWTPLATETFGWVLNDSGPADALTIAWPVGGLNSWKRGGVSETMIVIQQDPTTPVGGGTNQSPTAVINARDAAQVNDKVPVDGLNSDPGVCANIPDNAISSYSWTVLSHPPGDNGTFEEPGRVSTTFTGATNGYYEIQLTVSNKCGLWDSAQNWILFTNVAPPSATAPTIDRSVHAGDYTTKIKFTTSDAGADMLYTWTAVRVDTGEKHVFEIISSENSGYGVRKTQCDLGPCDMPFRKDQTIYYDVSVMVSNTTTHLWTTSPSSRLTISAWPVIDLNYGPVNWMTTRGAFNYDLPVNVTIRTQAVGLNTQGAELVLLDQTGQTVALTNLDLLLGPLPLGRGAGAGIQKAFTYPGELVWDDWHCTVPIPKDRSSTWKTFAVGVKSWQDANGFTLDEDDSPSTKDVLISVDPKKWPAFALTMAEFWVGIEESTIIAPIAAAACGPCAAVELGLEAFDLWHSRETCKQLHEDPPSIDINFLAVATVSLPQIDINAAVAPDQTSYLAAFAAEQTMLIDAEWRAYDQSFGKLFGAYQANSVNGMLLQAPELLRHAVTLDRELETYGINLLAAQQALGVPSRQTVLDLQQQVATNGFPQREVDVLQQLGYTQAQIEALRADFAALDLTTLPIGVPDNIDELLRPVPGAYYRQAYGLVPGGWVLVAVTQPRPGDTVSGKITIDARVVHKKEETIYCLCGPALATILSVDGRMINPAPYPGPLFYPPPPNGNSYCPPPAVPFQQAVPFQLDTTTLADGPHTITVTAMDSCRPGADPRVDINSDTITIYVDNTPPVITLTSPAQVNCGDPITYQVTDPISNGYTSGAVDPMYGTMSSKVVTNGTITIRVADRAGNATTTNVTVTVVDTEPPVITCPANMTVSADDGQCSATVSFSVTATDNCDPAPKIVCTPASGSAFAVGATLVTCTATDASGNQSQCTFTVTVTDGVPPVITCPANMTVSADPGACSAKVTFSVTATDNCDPVPKIVCTPASGSAFAVGATLVTCTATDASGNQSQCTFTVTVTDGVPPVITCPANMTVSADPGACSAKVTFSVTATDNCDPVPKIVCTPASGSAFAVGATLVTCTATDASGNQSQCSFTVTVNDNERPKITCPADVTVPPDPGKNSAVVKFATPLATDNCGSATVVCSPPSGSVFPQGTTPVTCTAADTSGNYATCTFKVTVKGSQPPAISGVSASPKVLWPPDHEMVFVTVKYTVTSSCGAPVCTLSVTSNEPVPPTAPDWVIVDAHHVLLRAERLGKGNGRIYTITITCTDQCGNVATQTVQVKVPHDGDDGHDHDSGHNHDSGHDGDGGRDRDRN